ncbi:hypothetical protein HAX54_023268, partial [Datura stramonium]|nr:hypothetical protein [Datura stramonium]
PQQSLDPPVVMFPNFSAPSHECRPRLGSSHNESYHDSFLPNLIHQKPAMTTDHELYRQPTTRSLLSPDFTHLAPP